MHHFFLTKSITFSLNWKDSVTWCSLIKHRMSYLTMRKLYLQKHTLASAPVYWSHTTMWSIIQSMVIWHLCRSQEPCNNCSVLISQTNYCSLLHSTNKVSEAFFCNVLAMLLNSMTKVIDNLFLIARQLTQLFQS